MSLFTPAVFSALAAALLVIHFICIKKGIIFDFSTERTTTSRTKKYILDASEEQQIRHYRELYFKLQNLEDYPEILSLAREELVKLLCESFSSEKPLETGTSILDIETYNRQELETFVSARNEDILRQYQYYVERRASGHGPELFSTRYGAEQWLNRNAPLKFVDGAWLGHIHRITTPFALRGVIKMAWQVLSEELGDGDLEKNHVHIYRNLLRDIGSNIPDGDSIDFIDSHTGMDDISTWKAAVTQLLVSLGFNLHFEQLTLETLKATRELPLFGISAYYFLLHISIDNADSGHTAMALGAISSYMSLVKGTEGEPASLEIWKRIQAGYILSRSVNSSDQLRTEPGRNSPSTEHAAKVLSIFQLKARASKEIHCTSKVRIGQQTLQEWLSPDSMDAEPLAMNILDSLANATPWVRRNNSNGSLLIRELSWGGKMFGAFTDTEVKHVRNWIDSLNPAASTSWQSLYRHWHRQSFPSPADQDPALHHPAFPPPEPSLEAFESTGNAFVPRPPLQKSNIHPSDIISLWFSHACLLENIISTPFKTSTLLSSHIVCLLRAEYGFMPEPSGVAGIDEQLRGTSYYPSLVDLGIEIARRYHLPEPKCLKDTLGGEHGTSTHAQKFAYSMLRWAMQPVRNAGLLLGLSRAFLDFETWVTGPGGLLDTRATNALRRITDRKVACFELCLQELIHDECQYREFLKGYGLGRAELEEALKESC
ncbi:hypothetical protein ACEPPN_011489 [Leptodophora sp. 'Broadleaf-Isolate-01']